MGLFKALSRAIYHEYDRRIKRASEISEYGLHHHDHDAEHHDDGAHHEEAEITNIPRGAPVADDRSSAANQH